MSFGAHSLAPVVARYLDRFPEVEVDLVLNDRMVDLVEDGFDATIRIGPLPDSRLTALRLAPFRLAACASPAYLRRRPAPSTPADLADHDCVTYAHWPDPSVQQWRFTRDGQTVETQVRSRLRVNNAAALLQVALAGFGIVFIAEDLARAALRDGTLVRVLPAYDAPTRPVHLLHHPDRRTTPKLRAFIDTVMEQLGDGPDG